MSDNGDDEKESVISEEESIITSGDEFEDENSDEENILETGTVSTVPAENEEYYVDPCYMVKFSEESREEYIQKFHPEEVHLTFDNIYQLTLIKRDKDGRIIDPLHTTYPILSKYEKTKLIGLRVSQLNRGAEPYVKFKTQILDNAFIAEKELQEKLLPFIIKRPLPNSTCEYWNVKDLEYL